jgi:hypothetical protein
VSVLLREVADGCRDGTSEVVCLEHECRQIDEVADGIWYGTSEVVREEVECRQIDKIANGIWYGTSEVVRGEAEVRQIDKVADGVWYGASEVARWKLKGRDSASRRVAYDIPCGRPRRQWIARVRVVPRRPDPATSTALAPVRSTRLLPQIAQRLHRRRRDGAEAQLSPGRAAKSRSPCWRHSLDRCSLTRSVARYGSDEVAGYYSTRAALLHRPK